MGLFDKIYPDGFDTRTEPTLSTPKPSLPSERPRYRNVRSMLGGMMMQGADTGRTTASWATVPLTPDAIIFRNLRPLVARSRQQHQDNDYARAFVRMCRQNIVGSNGITLQAQNTDNAGNLLEAQNQAIEAAWREWSHRNNCDILGQQSFRGMQKLAVQSAAVDGEFFFRKIVGPAAGAWGFALQAIDAQRCPSDYWIDELPGGGFIRSGIEYTREGRPVAYHFLTEERAQTQMTYSYGGRAYLRIPADEIIHGFKADMVGQKRGLPWMASGLFRMHHLHGLEDAAVINARVGAAKMGFIQWKDGNTGPEYDDDEGMEIDAEAGVFPVLPAGAELGKWDPQYPSGEFAPFAKHLLRGASAGWGVCYNNLANDLEGVNFSSIRQGTLDERERWKEDQEWLIEQFIQPVFEAWLPIALLNRRIRVNGQPLQPSRLDSYSSVDWQPRRWDWVDPRADVDAEVESKNNFLRSPGQIIRDSGNDPSAVWAQTARDLRAMVNALMAQGFDEQKATDLVMLSMGQPLKPPMKPDQGAKT